MAKILKLINPPLLESCFGEWLAQDHYGSGLRQNIAVLEWAILRSYPGVNLYYKLDNFFWQNQQLDCAQEAYQSTTQARSNETVAGENLKYLNAMEKLKPGQNSSSVQERYL